MTHPNINDGIAEGFRYRDFIECSTTWRRTRAHNTPQNTETFIAITKFCMEVLVPIQDEIAKPQLTFGFCSEQLSKKICEGISPSKDQHAGYELNSRGKRICKRGGFASDFYVPGANSLEIAQWIVRNTHFDRMYFYGSDRPIHVSVNENPIGQIVTMTTITRDGRRMPKVVSPHKFLTFADD